MREYIVQYERKKSDNPKDKCDLCNHAIVGELVRCKDCKWYDDKGEIKQCTIIPWRAYCTTENGFCDRAKMKGGND